MNKRPLLLSCVIVLLCLCLTACDVTSFFTEQGTSESTTEETTPAETTSEETPSDGTATESTPPESDSAEAEPQETTDPDETEPQTPKKRVAITFDDGPSRQGLTEKLVDEFGKYNGRATFFVLGNLISSATGDSLAYAHAHGFEIGIHGYTHDIYYDTCSEQDFLDELANTKAAIERYIDTEVTLLRPPGGRITRERALASGYPILFWSIDTEDWRYRARTDEQTIRQNVDTIVENALKNVEDGDIILMHEIYTNTYEATCQILARLHEMGFEFVTVTELLGSQSLTPGAYIYSKTNIK